ncbi:PLP-dependent aminotransferase family protein [Aureimonas fodinaquatilis]|uniref:PLP-dependent aminotransferase family protein n=2 Tax=Aureimonas fodinaquatilis TaxID=2565783 RepID=A0A5B0E183_9HYPH|nr:PLP-dependent aminotransferase family protein [Aureimonas fodinaquatilis]
MEAVRARIASRALTNGDRLPSIRGFAGIMGVSPATVVEAYDRLVAEGLLRAKAGSGFYVSASALLPLSLPESVPAQARAVDPFWVSRQSLDAGPDTAKPGCGWLPPDWMPAEALRRALRNVARADASVLTDYAASHGSHALRRLLLARLHGEGINASANQLLLCGSGTQAIDLICRLLVKPGDAVLVDDPCYFNFRALLRAHQIRVVSVPYTQNGPDIAAFETVLATERPRLYITNSALHNPTGATLSAHNAHLLLNAAASHDLTVVEDDIFADFEPEPTIRLAALDGLNRVIRIGSFSKTLSASLRCGYIAARPEWIAELADVQVATSFGGPSPVITDVIANVLSGGFYRKHMEDLRQRLLKKQHEVATKLRSIGIEPWLMPRGGFYLWCRLPKGCDSADIARLALEHDIVLAPGNVFSAAQTSADFMRFNSAQCDDPRFWQVLAQAVQAGRAQPTSVESKHG